MIEKAHIKIISGGPYIVSGNVPLSESTIVETEHGNLYRKDKDYQTNATYALCRCGHSKNMPFCDGTHGDVHFNGKEYASKAPYLYLADKIDGPEIYLTDQEDLCAFARFCHRKEGDVWELAQRSDEPGLKEEAILAAYECPAGRLIAWDKKEGTPYDETLPPSIVILQDPSRNCSGPLWVRGGIPIESSDGSIYEIRNRVTLCRCGESGNKPFCDAMHVSIEFSDKDLR